MNALVTLTDGQAVTTSLAIAEGTENQHKNVLELVRTYEADLAEFGRVAFETRPFATAGGTQQREVAILNEQQSTLLLTYMRNSDIVRRFKKALVKAFYELTAQRQRDPVQVLNDPAAMRGLLLTYADKVLALESTVQTLAPKAEALDRFATFAEGSMCITNAAKALGQQPKAFFRWLQEHQWIFRRAGGSSWIAYQQRLQVGYLDHKVTTVERSDGSTKTVEQVLVTAKGLAKLSEQLGRFATA